MTAQRWFEDGKLRFALGIEDTFVPQGGPGQRPMDEYELMQHYRFWEEDLSLVAESGASMLRWGIPWHKVNPERGRWDWEWLDRVIDRLEIEGIDLIADLIHYGTPLWLEDEFANPDYPKYVAEYAAAVASRYRGRIRHYTPANEPLLSALYSGEFGHWPPYLTGDRGLVTMVRAISRGIVETQAAIASVDPTADFVHVEASFRFAGDVEAHGDLVRHLRDRAYLIQDLVMGRVDDGHPLTPYLLANGFSDADLAWASANVADPDVIGVNYYPQHSTELFEKEVGLGGGPDQLRPRSNDGVEGLADVVRAFADRYRKPVFLTETGFTGTVEQRIQWLDDSVAAITELRAEGVPVVGYTWWCLTDMIEWTYRYGTGRPTDYQLAMGLWALEEDEAGALRRVRTPLADRFRVVARP